MKMIFVIFRKFFENFWGDIWAILCGTCGKAKLRAMHAKKKCLNKTIFMSFVIYLKIETTENFFKLKYVLS